MKPPRRIGSAFDKYSIGLGFYMTQEFINTGDSANNANVDPLSTAFANVANNVFSFPSTDSNAPAVVEVIKYIENCPVPKEMINIHNQATELNKAATK